MSLLDLQGMETPIDLSIIASNQSTHCSTSSYALC